MQQVDIEANKTISELFSTAEQNESLNSLPSSIGSVERSVRHSYKNHKKGKRSLSDRFLRSRNQFITKVVSTEEPKCGPVSENYSSVKYWHYKETGVKSRPIKLLKHPIEHLERKIIITYILGFLFKFIAIITGPLIVILILLITIPFLSIRRFTWFLLNQSFISDAHIETDTSNNYGVNLGNQHSNWKYCPLDYLEAYWFKEKLVNTIILVVDQKGENEFSIEKLRGLMRENVLSKPEFKKFRSSIVARGIPYYRSYYWKYLDFQKDNSYSPPKDPSSPSVESIQTIAENDISSSNYSSETAFTNDNNQKSSKNLNPLKVNEQTSDTEPFRIENHIFLDDCLKDESSTTLASIRCYTHKLMHIGLNLNRPLWELRVIPTKERKTYLILRCHQSLADGKSLTEVLIKYLSNHHNENVDSKNYHSDDTKTETENNLKLLEEKNSFISKFSESSGLRSAVLIGPLTVLLWIIWSFTRRKNNHLNKCRADKNGSLGENDRRFYMSHYDLTKFFQIKQMTRSTVSDIILCALSGSLREHLKKFNAVSNPPNLNISLTIDMSRTELKVHHSGASSFSNSPKKVPRVQCTLLNVPLPTSVEGAVPRLWALRNTMEELRASADPWVMIGLQKFLFTIFPLNWCQWLTNRIALRNSSTIVSNIQGPQNMVESWCVDLYQKAFLDTQEPSKVIQHDQMTDDKAKRIANKIIKTENAKFKLKNCLKFKEKLGSISEIYYCLQPPSTNIPISFNCITYQNKLFITILSQSLLVEDSKLLCSLFFKQLNQLAHTIAKRKSLVTIVRTPLPVEISCKSASPTHLKGSSDVNTESGERSNLSSNPIFQRSEINELKLSSPRIGMCPRGREDETSVRLCQSINCTCKRRKSLINFNGHNSLLVSRANTIVGSRSDAHIETEECICGLQLLHDLDEETCGDDESNKKASSENTTAIQPKQRSHTRLFCKKCKPLTKHSTISLNETIKTRSSQLHIPKVGTNLHSKGQSKSETDLFPEKEVKINDCQTCSKDSWFPFKKLTIFNKSSSFNESSASTRVSAANIQSEYLTRNLVDLPAELFHKRYIERSKRRQSIATSLGISQYNRTVVVKDEINADVNLRYNLEGPFTTVRGRRFSTTGNERSSQRRASLIPFGFIHNQSFPKLLTEDHEAHL